MIKVCIVDDHSIVREGLKQILNGVSDIQVTGEAASGNEFLTKMRTTRWDVIILDISLPDHGGLDILKEIKRDNPKLPVLILTMHDEDQYALRVFKAGASGYLTKESAPNQLIAAIRKVYRGGRFVSANLAEKLVDNLGSDANVPPYQRLSDREFEVIRLIGAGCSMTEIASKLNLSIKTISTYRARILEKLGLRSNAEIIHYVIRNRLNAGVSRQGVSA